MNKDKIDKYIETLTEDELIEYVKNTVQSISKLQKSRDKALKKELEAPVNCSREKRTTLYANSEKISIQYQDQIEVLKYITKKL